MATRKFKFLLWFSVLVILLACVPSMNTSVPTADPNKINIFIAQTAKAAVSQTAAAVPTSTPTETIVPSPEDTSTPSPTYTSTVIFILSSPTRPVVPTFTNLSNGGTATSSANFACQVISINPPNGTSFSARTDFDAVWRVKNIGKKSWDRTTVDYVYVSGAKIHKVATYDLGSTVKVGQFANVTVAMKAPKASGSYTTNWTIRTGTKEFCPMSLTIIVK